MLLRCILITDFTYKLLLLSRGPLFIWEHELFVLCIIYYIKMYVFGLNLLPSKKDSQPPHLLGAQGRGFRSLASEGEESAKCL